VRALVVQTMRIPLSLALLLAVGLLVSSCLGPGPNRPPVAEISVAPPAGYVPLLAAFDASGSADPDGRVVSYEWSFGDGKAARGETASHSYVEAGTYTVSLRVVDNRGGEDTTTVQVIALTVPAGQLVRHYHWEHRGEAESLEVLLPENLYRTYDGRTRQPLVDNYNYDLYVLDPLDDPTLEDLARLIAQQAGQGDEAFSECALAFVQGAIRYAADPPGIEYPLYPLETLVEGQGDCEDTTILYVSLIRALSRPVSMAFVDTNDDDLPDHVLALVPVSSTYPGSAACPSGMSKRFWTIDGTLYALAETTAAAGSTYVPLGCDPWGLEQTDIKKKWDF